MEPIESTLKLTLRELELARDEALKCKNIEKNNMDKGNKV